MIPQKFFLGVVVNFYSFNLYIFYNCSFNLHSIFSIYIIQLRCQLQKLIVAVPAKIAQLNFGHGCSNFVCTIWRYRIQINVSAFHDGIHLLFGNT